jgi:diaminohydroxyphosphoribosylaminopyrimidine deaminase/5-amino-6-(5-phosphoribosylamino)uracil reductase
MNDADLMDVALALARGVKGQVSPNPAVGALIARGGKIVASGATAPPGGPHAEAAALSAAGPWAKGATLFTTLEPCCHEDKKTPPCTRAIVAAGVAAVVCGTEDENPRVAGKGLVALREAGIEVRSDVRAAECRRLNADFFKHVRAGMPLVTVKFAASLDGKIAAATGDSRWISSEESRRHARRMRSRFDAICIGARTLRVDDPVLSVPVGRQPLRVVVSASGDIPAGRRMFAAGGPVLVAVPEEAASRIALPSGAELFALPPEGSGVSLRALLARLGGRGVMSLLVEGGGTLAAAFLEAGLVDRVLAYVATGLVGGRDAPTSIEGHGVASIADMLRLSNVRTSRLGGDLLVEGELGTRSPEDKKKEVTLR